MGVAITLSLGKRLEKGATPASLFPSILRRSALLYLFGLVIYAAPAFDLSTERLLGVLQRIAICYLAGSALYLTTRVRGQILWIVGLLAGYWILMMLVPVPGFGAGDLSVEGNFAHYVDRLMLGHHNYASTKTWDPEGIVSTLPSIATVLLGIMAGHILKLKRPIPERAVWLFVAGGCLLVAGLACDIWLPINKKLWTSSFALFMGGLDFMVFAGMFWLVDGCGWKRGARPMVIMGMNAIAVYMAAELLEVLMSNVHLASGAPIRTWVYQTLFVPMWPPGWAAFLYAAAYTGLMYCFAYLLYRKRWFLRV